MRIVLVGDGTRGDLQPLIELATRARDEGHAALVCGPPDFRELADARGVAYAPLGESMHALLSERADVVNRNPVSVIRQAIALIRDRAAGRLAALVELTRGADLVLAAGAEAAAVSAAEYHGIPYRYVCYCPALLPSREHAPVFLNWDGGADWINRLLWPLVMRPIRPLLRRLVGPSRAALGLPAVRDPYGHMLGARPLLAADPVLARPPRDAAVLVDQIPALHPTTGEALPAKLASFLDAGPPPVYFGFGSMPDTDPAATTREILAAVERLGVRAIVSSGWARLGGVPLPDGVIEIGAVTHPLLFPRCAAIVHHGGAGTTTNALRAGTPQVVVPHLADQTYWGRRVELLGVGVRAPRKHRTAAGDLMRCLGAVLDNEIVAERARELGAQARAEASDPAPVARLYIDHE